MGRRSDHSRPELRTLLIDAGQRHIARRGLTALSARAVAKDIGYTVGTIYNVFGDLDAFILAVNTRTFRQWTDHLDATLAACAPDADRIAALVHAYFDFAAANTNAWLAIFDHHRPPGILLDEAEIAERALLTGLVDTEVARFLGRPVSPDLKRLTRSLVAVVHGHCILALGGSFALMGERSPVEQAIERVNEALASARDR